MAAYTRALSDAGHRRGLCRPAGVFGQGDDPVDQYAAALAADAAAVVLITEWNEFRALDLERIRDAMQSPVFVDLRNVYRPREMEALGFDYSSIGRG